MKTHHAFLLVAAVILAGCKTNAPQQPAAVESHGRQAAWVQEFLKTHLKSARLVHGVVIFSSDGQLGTFTDDAGTEARPSWILPVGGHFNSKLGQNPALELTVLSLTEQEVTLTYVWSSVDESATQEALAVDQGKIKLRYFGPPKAE